MTNLESCSRRVGAHSPTRNCHTLTLAVAEKPGPVLEVGVYWRAGEVFEGLAVCPLLLSASTALSSSEAENGGESDEGSGELHDEGIFRGQVRNEIEVIRKNN